MTEHTPNPHDSTVTAPEESTPDGGGPAATPSETGSMDVLQKERDEFYDRLLRKTAEFDNFRKRVERDRKEMIEWAAADVLSGRSGHDQSAQHRGRGVQIPPGRSGCRASATAPAPNAASGD